MVSGWMAWCEARDRWWNSERRGLRAWNPEKDKLIAAKYSAKDLSGKQVCKQDLLEVFGLPAEHLSRPLIGIVSRFADQRDLI